MSSEKARAIKIGDEVRVKSGTKVGPWTCGRDCRAFVEKIWRQDKQVALIIYGPGHTVRFQLPIERLA
jgi:hypothetical protein